MLSTYLSTTAWILLLCPVAGFSIPLVFYSSLLFTIQTYLPPPQGVLPNSSRAGDSSDLVGH